MIICFLDRLFVSVKKQKESFQMSENSEIVLGNNILIHFKLPKFSTGLTPEEKLSRELWSYLRPGHYRISDVGQMVPEKALDMKTHNFMVDGEKDSQKIADFIRRSADIPQDIPDRIVSTLPVIPVVACHSYNDRGNKFGLICQNKLVVYFVSLSEKFVDTKVRYAAIEAVKLLNG